MQKRVHTLIILLTLGVFMLPALSYACGTNSGKSSCKKKSSKTEKTNCCNDEKSSHDTPTCNGKCGHSNCTNSTVSFSAIPLLEINLKNNSFDFSEKKSKFYHTITFISSGYSSVWLPPKIK